MFVTEYCTDPDNIGKLYSGSKKYDDSISEEYDQKRKTLDRYLYLVDNYTIILDCSRDLRGIAPHSDDGFWRVNKCLLNYVNAVFCYREFIRSYNPPLTRTADQFYSFDNGKEWYRFVCELRNHVIHQSIIINYFDPDTGDIYIDLSDLEAKQKKKMKDKNLENNVGAVYFLNMIQRLSKTPDRMSAGKPLYSMKRIAINADKEIKEMSDSILLEAYKKAVRPIIKWLLLMVQCNEEGMYYTFLVDKTRKHAPIEPNYSIEWYFKCMLQRLKKENIIIHNMRHLLETNGYKYFYDGGSDISTFIDKWGK